ncbi:MAG: hypothetical protein IJ086_01090 [Clostridium sp.]|nr:hypothetical protein [Clostridium sp.]
MERKEEISIGVRLTRETLIEIERFIVAKGLHRYRIKPTQVATLIVKDWLENPILDKSKIIYGRISNEPRTNRITIKLLEEENIKLYEIYVKEYIRECSSVNVLLYNIILQFLKSEGTLSILKELM